MTKEEIKSKYSMADVVGMFGLRPNRAGFIRCPFHHGDNDPSLKVYKDSFYCYGCHASGDVFSFVQLYNKCSFNDAFKFLGGTRENFNNRSEYIHAVRDRLLAKQKADRIQEQKNILLERLKSINADIALYNRGKKELEPFSDAWCFSVEQLQRLEEEYKTVAEEVKRM